MNVRRIRPRFRLSQSASPDEVVSRIVGHVKRPDCPCEAMVSNPHRLIELRVKESDRHLWSPVLSVTVAERKTGTGAVVHGLLGPSPSVWTFFAMLYVGLWTMVTFAAIFGLVQWSLDESPWGIWAAAGLLLTILIAYAASQFGQRLAAPQTAQLRHVLEEALDVPVAGRAVTDYDPYHKSS